MFERPPDENGLRTAPTVGAPGSSSLVASREIDSPNLPPAPDTGNPSPLLAAAAYFTDLGWHVVPVEYRSKKPSAGKGWQHLRLRMADLPRHFGRRGNIGVLLGEPSGWLVDVDLDCPEAVELAPRFLQSTWTFGRPGKPRSHWLYVAKGAGYRKFVDKRPGEKAKTILELRSSSDGKGRQTVFPPSVHESGEPIEWEPEDADAAEAPVIVGAADLERRVTDLAAAALVMRHAGREATLAWIAGAPCPPVPTAVSETVRRWWGIETPARPRKRHASRVAVEEFSSAAEAYNADHPRDLPRPGSGQCPICGHRGCFGRMGDNPARWACFSTSHDGAGIQGEVCWTGDFLDLDAHAAGLRRDELLRREGYLGRRAA